MTNNKIISKLAPSFLPATAVLEMTHHCNHQCLFCSCPWEAKGNNFKKQSELGLTEWKNSIAGLTNMGVCNLAFSGGEPLLNKHLFELIEFASSCQAQLIETENDSLITKTVTPNIYLISNGGLMTEEVLDLCLKNNVHLSMSLPGLTTYTYHTQQGDAQNILNWFSRAKYKGVSTTVNITVTKKNIFELYETISEALIAGADTLLMNRFLPGGRGLEYAEELTLSVDEVNHMLDIAEEVLTTANIIGSVGTELPKCLIKRDNYVNLTVGTTCSAALDFFVIGPSGYIRTCNHSPVQLNHISKIEDLKQHPYWKRFTAKDYYPSICEDCEILFHCDGGCREAAHIYSGSLDGQDPLMDDQYSC